MLEHVDFGDLAARHGDLDLNRAPAGLGHRAGVGLRRGLRRGAEGVAEEIGALVDGAVLDELVVVGDVDGDELPPEEAPGGRVPAETPRAVVELVEVW